MRFIHMTGHLDGNMRVLISSLGELIIVFKEEVLQPLKKLYSCLIMKLQVIRFMNGLKLREIKWLSKENEN